MKSLIRKILVSSIQFEAKMVLKKYKPRIVAITGNVGKTATKDMAYTTISTSLYARKSKKSFNSEIGIPLTILGCKNPWSHPIKWGEILLEGIALMLLKNHYPNWVILEVGADMPGDIKSIAKWINPDVTILTRIPDTPVHIEFFESLDELIDEKASLVKATKTNGVVILNHDDPNQKRIKDNINSNCITYGAEEGADYKTEEYQINYEGDIPKGIEFKISSSEQKVSIQINDVIGSQYLYPAGAAVATADYAGIDLTASSQTLKNFESAPGRMRILKGINNTILIDDSYNSSPAALEKALDSLKNINTKGRKMVALGDMLELGEKTVGEHKTAGEQASSVADIIFTVGVRSKKLAKSAQEKRGSEKGIFEFDETTAAAEKIKELIKPGDIILIKGSQSMRMEKVTEILMADPAEKHRLLPRQNMEWQKR